MWFHPWLSRYSLVHASRRLLNDGLNAGDIRGLIHTVRAVIHHDHLFHAMEAKVITNLDSSHLARDMPPHTAE